MIEEVEEEEGAPGEGADVAAAAGAGRAAAGTEARRGGALGVSFNQDGGCFACGLEGGFAVFNVSPFRLLWRRELGRGGIAHVQMLFRSNLLAVVGGGAEPRYPPTQVLIWEDSTQRFIGEVRFRKQITGVRLRRDKLVVAVVDKIYVYRLADLVVVDQMFTAQNPKGLCALTTEPGSTYLAFPALQQGQVTVRHYESDVTVYVKAHQSDIAQLELNADGTRLATASDKGTLIRIFDTATGNVIRELRRGTERAEIYSLAFNRASTLLAATSNKGTAHVFAIPPQEGTATGAAATGLSTSEPAGAPHPAPMAKSSSTDSPIKGGQDEAAPSNTRLSFRFVGNLLPSRAVYDYLGSEWSFVQFRGLSGFVQCRFSESVGMADAATGQGAGEGGPSSASLLCFVSDTGEYAVYDMDAYIAQRMEERSGGGSAPASTNVAAGSNKPRSNSSPAVDANAGAAGTGSGSGGGSGGGGLWGWYTGSGKKKSAQPQAQQQQGRTVSEGGDGRSRSGSGGSAGGGSSGGGGGGLLGLTSYIGYVIPGVARPQSTDTSPPIDARYEGNFLQQLSPNHVDAAAAQQEAAAAAPPGAEPPARAREDSAGSPLPDEDFSQSQLWVPSDSIIDSRVQDYRPQPTSNPTPAGDAAAAEGAAATTTAVPKATLQPPTASVSRLTPTVEEPEPNPEQEPDLASQPAESGPQSQVLSDASTVSTGRDAPPPPPFAIGVEDPQLAAASAAASALMSSSPAMPPPASANAPAASAESTEDPQPHSVS